MQNTTKNRVRRGAVISALVVIGILAVYLAVVLYGLLTEAMMPLLAVGILILYAAAIVAVMVGILAALRQRLKEIEGGEEDVASKY